MGHSHNKNVERESTDAIGLSNQESFETPKKGKLHLGEKNYEITKEYWKLIP